MPQFTGQLRPNEIFGAIYNMIISQQVHADNIKGTFSSLVDRARVDGSLYGDTKLYYDTDVLESHAWGADAEAPNLLDIHRPDDPKCQKIVLDVFRQIDLTVDYYLSKRAWGDEGVFTTFTGVLLAWIRETKRVYDSTLYNTFIGTTVTNKGKQLQFVDLAGARANASTEKEALQLEGMEVGRFLADLLVDLRDVSRDYNDYGYLRSHDEGEIKFIFNSKKVNKIRYVDLPTIFHKEGIEAKITKEILPARYFGTTITSANLSDYSASTPAAGKPIDSDTGAYTPGANHANGTIRSNIETKIKVANAAADPRAKLNKKDNKYYVHLFPGDELPAGAIIAASEGDIKPGEIYIEEDDVVCKVLTDLPAFMSAFEVGTSFFNAKSLTENHYLTWGHNTLEYFLGKPFITIKEKPAN